MPPFELERLGIATLQAVTHLAFAKGFMVASVNLKADNEIKLLPPQKVAFPVSHIDFGTCQALGILHARPIDTLPRMKSPCRFLQHKVAPLVAHTAKQAVRVAQILLDIAGKFLCAAPLAQSDIKGGF